MKTGKASPFIHDLTAKTFWISIIILFVCASCYAYGILTAPKNYYSTITVAFLAALSCVFISNLIVLLRTDIENCPGELPLLTCYALTLHLALIFGFYLSGRPETALWVADSYAIHIPGASNVANYIHGTGEFLSIGETYTGIFLTQAFVGILFSFLGINPFSSSIALMIVKLLTVFMVFQLGRAMFNKKIAAIGALIYVFMPTILYYTTVFYKEAIIQFLVTTILLSVLKIFVGQDRPKFWLLLILAMAGLVGERGYLCFLFMAAFIPLALITARFYRNRYPTALFTLVGCGVIYAVLKKYVAWMILYHLDSKNNVLLDLLAAISNFKLLYSSFPDVTPINSTLIYPLAFVKILFTPFFTLNKFTLFSDYSYILIWGSFINQAVILLSLYGMYKALKSDWRRNWFLIMPFFLFLCVFAYVAPYIGRLRDSFYPLIAIYAAHGIMELRWLGGWAARQRDRWKARRQNG
jgi:hypothetical protein